MARGRKPGTHNRPKHIIEQEKREKERIRAQRIANGEVIRRGRKPGTPNRSKEVIQAEKEARAQLKAEKQATREVGKSNSVKSEPSAIPVNSVFVLKSEVGKVGLANARQFVVVSSSPWLIDWVGENGVSHCTVPENITIVGHKDAHI